MAAYRFPSDVMFEILVRLPMKRVLCLKSVCKDWYTLINSSAFIQSHLSKSLEYNFRYNHTFFYTNNDSLCVVDDIYHPSKPIKLYWPKEITRNSEYPLFVGSCNGLLCFCVIRPTLKISCFLICNPSTHTFKFKPTFPFTELKCLESRYLSYGFGYDSEHDDYKIVVTRKIWKESERDVYIYSCKADSWKCVTHTLAEGSSGSNIQKPYKGVVFANMLQYIVYSPVNVQEKSKYRSYSIARLDLSSETWKDDLSFPVDAVETSTTVEIGVLDRCLYLRLGEPSCNSFIWTMKGYRDEELWSKTYCIPLYLHDYTLVGPSKDRPPRLLFERKYFDKYGPHLAWYDPNVYTTETFELEKSSRDTLLRLCIASLVKIPGSSINFRDELDDKDELTLELCLD